MKIKSGVWYWLAVASGAVGLLYGMGLEQEIQIFHQYQLYFFLK